VGLVNELLSDYDEDLKISQMQKSTNKLTIAFLKMLMLLIIAFIAGGIPLVVYYFITKTNFNNTDLTSIYSIIAVSAGATVPFLIPLGKKKDTGYSELSQLLHHIALDNYRISEKLFKQETKKIKRKNLERKKDFVIISGLARAGTTSLMNDLASINGFVSLSYSNMPFLLSPNLWGKLYKPKKKHGMLTNIIERYLTSIKEVQFFQPFINLLDVIGFRDIHLLHGPNEFGKDIIAKKDGKQFAFVVKVGDVNQSKFMNEVKGQLLEAQTNSLAHPNFEYPTSKIIFVTTGKITSQVRLALQAYNDYSLKKELPLVEVWTREFLVKEFSNSGVESFFNLHSNPEFIVDFYDTHSNIIQDKVFQSFDVEYLSKKWLKFDFSINLNRLQIFFEAFYFSKLLLEKNRNYEALLFVSALVRVLIVNNILHENEEVIKSFIIEIVKNSRYISNKKEVSDELKVMQGFFDIIYYPERCLEFAELLSIGILLEDKSLKEPFTMCLKEKGSFKPLSDNYAASVFFIAITSIKLNLITELKKYINNCTVWLCNRYEELGIAPVGSNKRLEYSQLLSEYLEGYEYYKNEYSLIVSLRPCTSKNVQWVLDFFGQGLGFHQNFRLLSEFIQRIPAFFVISRTPVNTAGLSSSCEEEGRPDRGCNHYYTPECGKEHQSATHADLHPGLYRFLLGNT